ncbi:hypothetical protein EVJ58_g6521 [Rhodofomes roseus]|uniref:Uncharacterized protein n=1 Tax=Rhodofomes roseus TaxID=34475 RepID=A0A4Y9Y9M0_9APHY|nr:hypothetical protein EVJ58_g6521 [Rhodofomes roseus]
MGKSTLVKVKACAEGGNRTPDNNPQLIYKKFKSELISSARELMKKKAPKLDAALRKLNKEINRLQNLPNYTEDHKLLTEVEALLDRTIQLERKRYQHIRESTTARYALNAESISKYWSNINREKVPRDIIYSLRLPDSQTTVTRGKGNRETA